MAHADYIYSQHNRTVASISGIVAKTGNGHVKGDKFAILGPVAIMENRVNGVPRTVTVLSEAGGRAIVRLSGHRVNY